MTLALPVFDNLVVGCTAVVILFACGCAAWLGGSLRTWLEDLLMVLLTEASINVAFQSPLDWAHLHGRPLADWALATGTGLALVGILLNHLAQRSGPPTKRRWRTG